MHLLGFLLHDSLVTGYFILASLVNGLQVVSQVNGVTSSCVSHQPGSLTRLLFMVAEAPGAIRDD